MLQAVKTRFYTRGLYGKSRLLIILLLSSLLGQRNTLGAQVKTYPCYFTVAMDGSGDFTSIQKAINAVRDLSEQVVTIYIKKGIYHEKLVIPSWKTKVHLIGEDKDHTIITNSDFSGKTFPGGDAFGRAAFSTYTSFTVLVQGNDFMAENLTIENASGPVGQAVALHVEGDRAVIKNCHLIGNQDTLYAANEKSRQFYINCYIEGTTDFIFGEATALFKDCILKSLANSYMTAAATTPRQAFGFVFIHCTLIAGDGIKKVYLGRPWRPYAKVAFLHCEMGSHILPQGWNNWGNYENEKTAVYVEYQNSGAGADLKGRVNWAKQLSVAEAKKYNLFYILGGSDNWTPLRKTPDTDLN